MFDKYYAKCVNTLCAVCGLAKALITLCSQMLVNEAPRVSVNPKPSDNTHVASHIETIEEDNMHIASHIETIEEDNHSAAVKILFLLLCILSAWGTV